MEIKIEIIKNIIKKCVDRNHCIVDVRYHEPMSAHTTFKVGGPADCWLNPGKENFQQFSADLLSCARNEGIPVFILGGGANIVVSDRGIRGIVLDICSWKGQEAAEEGLIVRSGTTMDEAAGYAASAGLSGIEFLSGMPGTVGGALWMNARCYGREIADVLCWAETISMEQLSINNEKTAKNEYKIKKIINNNKIEFGYKKSPFQKMDCLILNACFNLVPRDKDAICREMEKHVQDRKDKGHYLFPCAGSVFKNNRDFGKPAGQIIDELGLRGYQLGGAQIAPFHGNIIINKNNAAATDIRALMNDVAEKVKDAAGFVLEPEILFVGDWDIT
jgi:UDP-N-acetylmuramate dehydrogenase